jgi:hypothetical protein
MRLELRNLDWKRCGRAQMEPSGIFLMVSFVGWFLCNFCSLRSEVLIMDFEVNLCLMLCKRTLVILELGPVDLLTGKRSLCYHKNGHLIVSEDNHVSVSQGFWFITHMVIWLHWDKGLWKVKSCRNQKRNQKFGTPWHLSVLQELFSGNPFCAEIFPALSQVCYWFSASQGPHQSGHWFLIFFAHVWI